MSGVPFDLLNPAALWLLPLLAVLVFLARRVPHRPRRIVSSLHLWSASTASTTEQFTRRPRRRDWIVLLQAAFMLAVIGALVRPVIRGEARAPTTVAAPVQGAAPSMPKTPPRHVAVRLRTPASFFLDRALQSNPAVTLATGNAKADMEICEGCATAPASDTPILLIPAATRGNLTIASTIRLHGHPLAQGIDNVLVTPALAHLATEGADVVMRAGPTPVLVARQEDGRRIVTLNADVRSSSFPLTAAFPVLIANALEWLASGNDVPKVTGRAAHATVPGASPTELTAWLLIAALIILLIEWRLSARINHHAHRWRLVMCAALLLAVAGVQLPVGRMRTAVVFVLDRSSSLPLRVQRAGVSQINEMTSAMRQGDLAGLVTFGADASMDVRPGARREVENDISRVAGSGTNIEAALALARSALPVDAVARRIVLLTDGNETSGDASREAAAAAASHIGVDVVPLDAARMAVVPAVEAVRAPEDARAGEPFRLTVELTGRPRSRAAIALASDGGARAERDVIFDDDGYATAEFDERQDAPGTYVYRALLSTADGDDVAGGAVVTAVGAPRILYVSHVAAGALARALATAGFRLTPVLPSRVPLDDSGLAPFESVVLDDVPATALTTPQMLALSRYVERGGGVLLLGSPRSLDAAGYPQSALEPILPIDVGPRSGRRTKSMAFILVFDKSGSMGDRSNGVTKIELARESALRVMSMLPAGDSLGIIAFDAQPRVVAALGSADREAEIGAALRRIDANGSTSIGPAVELASSWLSASNASKKHVLLITDGRTSDADVARLRDAALTRGFELSVIAIGSDADRALLESVVAPSGGRAYFPENVRQLPAMVARDAAEASGGTVVNEVFQPQAPRPHPVLAGITPNSLPRLPGYVVGVTRMGAETILASHLGDPVLSAWRVGLGRVAMSTADLRTGFDTLWIQTARWVNRQATSDVLHLRATETDGGIDVRVDAERHGEPIALDSPTVALRTPSGKTLEAAARLIAPGRYEAQVTTNEVGAFEMAAGGGDARIVRGFYRSGERERAASGVNHTRLAQLAAMTGGRVLGPGDNPYRDARPFAWISLRPACALVALALLLVHLVAGTSWWRNRRVHAEPVREAA